MSKQASAFQEKVMSFIYRDKVCNAYIKQKPHDPEAPYDGYDESDDTEEKARSIYLKKQQRMRI